MEMTSFAVGVFVGVAIAVLVLLETKKPGQPERVKHLCCCGAELRAAFYEDVFPLSAGPVKIQGVSCFVQDCPGNIVEKADERVASWRKARNAKPF
jgi:hypothetical protein